MTLSDNNGGGGNGGTTRTWQDRRSLGAAPPGDFKCNPPLRFFFLYVGIVTSLGWIAYNVFSTSLVRQATDRRCS